MILRNPGLGCPGRVHSKGSADTPFDGGGRLGLIWAFVVGTRLPE